MEEIKTEEKIKAAVDTTEKKCCAGKDDCCKKKRGLPFSFFRIFILLAFFFITGLSSYQLGFRDGKNAIPSINLISNVENKNIPVEAPLKESPDTAKTGDNAISLKNLSEADFSIFWDTWAEVQKSFVGRQKLNPQDMIFGATKGMVASLNDPYSEFFTKEENKKFTEDVKGRFGGVGMEIGMQKGVLTVVAPLKNTPAERAGLMAGDKILKIDDKTTSDMTIDQAVNLIRGPEGTTVTLLIFREKDGAEPKEFKIVREVIVVPSLESEMKDNNQIGYIRVYSYSDNVSSDFRKAVIDFRNTGSKKLIIDLRNNPGGYLSAAIDMAGYFLPEGEVVALEDYGNGEQDVYYSKGPDIFEDSSVVILINGGSASASEIFAGALAEKKKAQLVGEKTFGKGSVQQVIDLKDDMALKLTIAKWLTPSGRSVSDEGIEPQIKVETPKDGITKENDPQLNAALDILRKIK
jgi:carboxyl-terminal processing protease